MLHGVELLSLQAMSLRNKSSSVWLTGTVCRCVGAYIESRHPPHELNSARP